MDSFLQYFTDNFHIKYMGQIKWAHSVNSKERLDEFLYNPDICILEVDISSSYSGNPIAAHPPSKESNLSLTELLEKIKTTKQGVKFDFKDPTIVAESIQLIAKALLSQPIILNADIVKGNSQSAPIFNASSFISQCNAYPKAILSLGWTTINEPATSYPAESISEMLSICENESFVLFPIRASLFKTSHQSLQPLIEKGGVLSFWNAESLSKEALDFIMSNTDHTKTLYDFSDEKGTPLALDAYFS